VTLIEDIRVGFKVAFDALRLLGSKLNTRLKDTLSDTQALISMFLLASIVSLSAFGGYMIGQLEYTGAQGLVEIPANFSDSGAISNNTAVTLDRSGLSAGSGTILRSAQAAGSESSEITNQLGQLRAELLRLHAVFSQLAEQAELDDGEFDLKSPLEGLTI